VEGEGREGGKFRHGTRGISGANASCTRRGGHDGDRVERRTRTRKSGERAAVLRRAETGRRRNRLGGVVVLASGSHVRYRPGAQSSPGSRVLFVVETLSVESYGGGHAGPFAGQRTTAVPLYYVRAGETRRDRYGDNYN